MSSHKPYTPVEKVQEAALQVFSAHVCVAGGSVQCLFVDNANSMVLAAMLDKVTRAYDLESKHPAIKYVGHEEVVRGIDYLPEKGLYITGELLSHHVPGQPGVILGFIFIN